MADSSWPDAGPKRRHSTQTWPTPARLDDRPPSIIEVRVAIASTVRLVRESLTLGLRRRAGLTVVEAVGLNSEGFARIAAALPDVILVDLGRTDAVTTAQSLRLACPQAKLVAFALDEVNDDVFACAAAGFAGYVPPESGTERIHQAVVDAASGRMRCAPHIAAAMFNRLSDLLRQVPAHASLPALTARENEIMTLAEAGRSNKEIARQLQISSSTVKNHIHNILQKLQVGRRGEAVARMRAPRIE